MLLAALERPLMVELAMVERAKIDRAEQIASQPSVAWRLWLLVAAGARDIDASASGETSAEAHA